MPPSTFPLLGGLAMLYFGYMVAREGRLRLAFLLAALGMASLALSFFI